MLPRAVRLRVVCFGRQNTTLFHLPLGSFRFLSPAQGEVGTSRSGYVPSPPRTAGAGDGDLGVSPGAEEAAGTVTPSACAWTSAVPRPHFGNTAGCRQELGSVLGAASSMGSSCPVRSWDKCLPFPSKRYTRAAASTASQWNRFLFCQEC